MEGLACSEQAVAVFPKTSKKLTGAFVTCVKSGLESVKVLDLPVAPWKQCLCLRQQQVHKKVPLTVVEVVFLKTLAIITGFVCFALYCRLRWSDAMHLEQKPVLDALRERRFVKTSLYSHKTVAAMKFRLLPVVAVLPGMSKLDWAGNWLRKQRDHNLVASRNCTLQPASVRVHHLCHVFL